MKISPKTSLLSYFESVYIPDRVNLRPRTIEQITISLRRFAEYLEREPTINDLDRDTITSFLTWYASRVAATTVNAKRKDLLALWRTAWNRNDTKKGPRPIRRVKEPWKEPRAYELDVMRKIIERAGVLGGTVGRKGKHRWAIERRLWWPALLATCYSTAARVGALLAVHTQDCELDRRALHIRADTQKQNADQTFILIPEAIEAIRAIWDPSRELLFWWPYGRRHFYQYYDRNIIKPLQIQSDRKGMDKFHKIRRTTISHVAAQSLDQAIKLAGHRHPTTTTRHYIDPQIVNPQGASPLIPHLTEPDDDPDGGMIFPMADYAAG